jgi:uncharacterized protein (TIGR00255 family)
MDVIPMVQSMTGFGQSGRSVCGCRLQVEMRSVNHRYLEISVRIPREWMRLEDKVKRIVQQSVKRGKVDVSVTVEKEPGASALAEIDWPLAEAYRLAAEQLKERFAFSDSLSLKDILALPGIVSFREAGTSAEHFTEPLLECVREAAAGMLEMRRAEGGHLVVEVAGRLDRLDRLRRETAEWAPKAVEEYKVKLHQRLTGLLGESAGLLPDDPRLLTEAAVMADRSDIREELVRLESHIGQCRKLLATDEPAGRKLDFLNQEMNREVNTIGSKSGHLEIVGRVVEMKAELEKIREQAQNIE